MPRFHSRWSEEEQRELEFLYAFGRSSTEISQAMERSRDTVRNKIREIRSKAKEEGEEKACDILQARFWNLKEKNKLKEKGK